MMDRERRAALEANVKRLYGNVVNLRALASNARVAPEIRYRAAVVLDDTEGQIRDMEAELERAEAEARAAHESRRR